MLNDKWYTILKWCGLVLCPALAVAVTALGQVWGIKLASQISTTVNVIGVFIGALIGVSQVNYNKTDED